MKLKEEREKRRKLELQQKQTNDMQNMREIALKQIYKEKERNKTKKEKNQVLIQALVVNSPINK